MSEENSTAKENIMVIYKKGEFNHYLFQNFLKSLPAETELILHSQLVFSGSYDKYHQGDYSKDGRGYMICRAKQFILKELDTAYFTSRERATIKQISGLKANIGCRVKVDKFILEGKYFTSYCTTQYKGGIDDMLTQYRQLLGMDETELFGKFFVTNMLKSDEYKDLTQRILFNKSYGRKTRPTIISLGLETSNNELLDYRESEYLSFSIPKSV